MRVIIATIVFVTAIMMAWAGHAMDSTARNRLGSVCNVQPDVVTHDLDGEYTLLGFSVPQGMKPAKFKVSLKFGKYEVTETGSERSEKHEFPAVIRTGAQPEFQGAFTGMPGACYYKTEMDARGNGVPLKLTILKQITRKNMARLTFYWIPEGRGQDAQVLIQLFDKNQNDLIEELWSRFTSKSTD